MIEIQSSADFFEIEKLIEPDAIVCTINKVVRSNNRLVMGAGIAKAFRDKYRNIYPSQDLDLVWGEKTKYSRVKNELLIDISRNGVTLIGLPTKNNWKDPSDINLISDSLYLLKGYIDNNFKYYSKILMTRPGCGNGGLSWENEVKPLMESIKFDNRYIVMSN